GSKAEIRQTAQAQKLSSRISLNLHTCFSLHYGELVTFRFRRSLPANHHATQTDCASLKLFV
ncbi:MAG: hypothetical protein JXB23_11520, partial [Candidatus Aminicenantes bacterium]|nr:hypothetical protein [Candidatus Aminicenantes bacterium]